MRANERRRHVLRVCGLPPELPAGVEQERGAAEHAGVARVRQRQGEGGGAQGRQKKRQGDGGRHRCL
eukprot:1176695-Prorocentrum_minimum.AAC.3